jgi:hypothetical protein
MPKLNLPPSRFQLKITLLGIKPPIWRRVEVPSTIPLSSLHDVIQLAMGWTDSHLHQFEKGKRIWANPEIDMDGQFDFIDERKTALSDVLQSDGDSLIYNYDFGDDWRHQVVLEKIELSADATSRPVCLAGKRRCPPEDVGGPGGYDDLLEAVSDPSHEQHEELTEWVGGPFDAEEFDLKEVNAELAKMKWSATNRG